MDGSIIDTTLNLLGDPTPASRLFEYTTAALRRGAKDYDLHLTVLLKGARGSGKRTVVKGVAKKAGFHCFEVRTTDNFTSSFFFFVFWLFFFGD